MPFFIQDKQGKKSLDNPNYEELEMKYKMMPKWVFLLGFLLFSGPSLFSKTAGASQVYREGEKNTYSSNHALIIVISEYGNGDWSYLENTHKDIWEAGEELTLKRFDQGYLVFNLQGKEHSGIFRDPLKGGGKGPEMCEVSSGRFLMGDVQSDEYKNKKLLRKVNVESFAAGRFEVTFAEYDHFCETVGRRNPDDNRWGRNDRPVINVSWEDALDYTRWLSEQTGHTYRLPTEAEWEYMARAGTETNYWWGNEPEHNKASCHGCGAQWGWDAERKTAPVGSLDPNPFGIYDTVGNVWEWTCSQYTDSYIGKETECIEKITTGSVFVVLRGGAWAENPKNCRVSYRKFGYPNDRRYDVGFRVVRELK